MPPRYSYWTILAGGLPTAFRAADRDDLLPTFQRIREKHPDAEMKWFARGKLWASPEEAQRDRERQTRGDVRDRRDRRGAGADRITRPAAASPDRTTGRSGSAEREREHRGRDWRPGGEHRDPR